MSSDHQFGPYRRKHRADWSRRTADADPAETDETAPESAEGADSPADDGEVATGPEATGSGPADSEATASGPTDSAASTSESGGPPGEPAADEPGEGTTVSVPVESSAVEAEPDVGIDLVTGAHEAPDGTTATAESSAADVPAASGTNGLESLSADQTAVIPAAVSDRPADEGAPDKTVDAQVATATDDAMNTDKFNTGEANIGKANTDKANTDEADSAEGGAEKGAAKDDSDEPSEDPTMRLDSDPTVVLDAPRQAGSPTGKGTGRVGRARAGVIIALLSGVLGFGLVVQAQNTETNSGLPAARQEDLVRILDDLDARQDRLRREISQLQQTRSSINSGAAGRDAALKETQRREKTLGILAGTVPASGPGLVLTINDPRHGLTADVILDAVQELRGAGAEAFQLTGADGKAVRIGVSSYFLDTGSGISVDGKTLVAPYKLLAIGDPPTMDTAMRLPGGVVGRVSELGAEVTIQQTKTVRVTALRPVTEPQYARPTS